MTNAFSNQWRGLMESLLHRGSAAGADLVEVFLERTDHIGLLAEQDRITSVNPSFARGAGLRVFRDGRDGFVSTNDLSELGFCRAANTLTTLYKSGRITNFPTTSRFSSMRNPTSASAKANSPCT